MTKRRGATCKSCGRPFLSLKGDNGRWTRTCSPPCRLAALDRMLSVLHKARARLAVEVETGDAA